MRYDLLINGSVLNDLSQSPRGISWISEIHFILIVHITGFWCSPAAVGLWLPAPPLWQDYCTVCPASGSPPIFLRPTSGTTGLLSISIARTNLLSALLFLCWDIKQQHLRDIIWGDIKRNWSRDIRKIRQILGSYKSAGKKICHDIWKQCILDQNRPDWILSVMMWALGNSKNDHPWLLPLSLK